MHLLTGLRVSFHSEHWYEICSTFRVRLSPAIFCMVGLDRSLTIWWNSMYQATHRCAQFAKARRSRTIKLERTPNAQSLARLSFPAPVSQKKLELERSSVAPALASRVVLKPSTHRR